MNKILLIALISFGLLSENKAQVFKLKSLPGSGVINRKEGGSTINIDMVYTGSPMSHTMSVKYTFIGKNAGAVVATDLSNISAATDTIMFNANDTLRKFTFKPVVDGLSPETPDTFIFKLTQALTMGSIGSPDSIIIVISDSVSTTPPPPTAKPFRTIGSIRTDSNIDGISDSTGITCTIRGVVHGMNFRTTGYQMSITDGTGWIGVFSNKNYPAFTTLSEGDSVEIAGKIEEFRGLSQINFSLTGDTIISKSSGTVRTAEVVNTLNELSESKLVKMDNLSLFSGTWLNDSAYTLVMQNTAGTKFDLRINNKPATNFGTTPLIITGKIYSITGLGGQFDQAASAPKTSGYQLIPRKSADIVITGNVGISSSEVNSFSIYPSIVSSSTTLNFTATSNELATIQLIDLKGRVAKTITTKILVGENEIKISDLNSLSNGHYILNIKGENISIQSKLTISK